jgi:hypothetical protein
MSPILCLCEDVLTNAARDLRLPALPRMIFIVHGAVAVDGRTVAEGEAWSGEGAASVSAGKEGATCWRFQLAPADAGDGTITGEGVSSRRTLSAVLETLPPGELLLRGDSVTFPPGGCAFLHRHQGPGIRCLIEGGIRIDTHGRSTSYGPGGAWYETGPDPVFAQGAADRATRFIRVMILPRALLGKSSIAYVNEEDRIKPKSQQYKIFADMPISVTR